MSLDDSINSFRPEIKKYVLKHLRQKTPFQYLMNLARVSHNEYGGHYDDALEAGVNTALDYYNKNPSGQRMFYGIVKGAESIIKYTYNNKEDK